MLYIKFTRILHSALAPSRGGDKNWDGVDEMRIEVNKPKRQSQANTWETVRI